MLSEKQQLRYKCVSDSCPNPTSNRGNAVQPTAFTCWSRTLSAITSQNWAWDSIPFCVFLEGRDNVLYLCCSLWSLQQVAIATGCVATTSADIVHCLREKTEEELLATTLKMVGMAKSPHFHPKFSVPYALNNYMGTFHGQCQPSDTS